MAEALKRHSEIASQWAGLKLIFAPSPSHPVSTHVSTLLFQPSICPSLHLSMPLSLHPSIHPSIRPPNHAPITLLLHLFIHLSLLLRLHPSTHLPMHLAISPSTHDSIYSFLHPPISHPTIRVHPFTPPSIPASTIHLSLKHPQTLPLCWAEGAQTESDPGIWRSRGLPGEASVQHGVPEWRVGTGNPHGGMR